ncbi:MAG: hypothetical protein IPH76_17450 [Xanthomonadales bacterium]|nr:hypothetical protein [Xanthomonadales bacterium]
MSLAPGTLLEITQVDNLRTRLNLEQAGCSDAGLPRQTKFTCTTPDAESGQLDCTLVDDAERSTVPCRPMASPPRISRLSVPLRYLPDGARHLQTPQQLMAQGWLAAAMGQHDVLCDDEKVCTRHFPVCSPGAIRRDLEEDATCGNPLPELKLDQWASMVEASDAQVRFWNGLLDPRLGDLSLAIATSPSGAPAVTQLEVNAFAALLPTIPATWRDQGNGATPSSEESHYASLLDALSYFRGNMRRADVPTGPIGWRTVGGALGVPGNAATTTTSMRRMLGLSDADFGTNGKHPVAYPYNVVPTRDSPFTYIADPSGGGMFDLQVRAVPGGVRWSDMVEPWSLAEWQASGIYGRFEPKLSSIDWQAGCASATGKVKRRRLSTALLWPGDPRVANVELRLDVQQTGHAALFLVPRGRDPALSSDHCAAIEMLRQMQRKKDGLRLDYRDLRRLDLPGGNDLAVRRCLVQPDASTCGVPWAFVPERFRYQGGDGGGQRRLSGDHKRCGALRWDAATGLGLEDVPCETRDLLSTFATAVAEHATSVSGWDLFRIPSPDVPHRITAIELPEVGPVAILQENAEGGCKPTLALAHSRHPWRGAIEVVPVAAPADGCPQAASEQVLWSLTPRHVLSVEGLTHSPLRGFAEAAP